jgi:hypothetical protein
MVELSSDGPQNENVQNDIPPDEFKRVVTFNRQVCAN